MTKTYKAKISGMSCNSCEQMISKAVAKVDGVKLESISAASGEMLYRSGEPRQSEIAKAVEEAGYRLDDIERVAEDEAGSDKGEKGEKTGKWEKAGSCSPSSMRAREVIHGLMNGHEMLRAERQLLVASFGSLVFLLLVIYLLFLGGWRLIPGFAGTYLPLLVMGAVSVVSIVGAGYHFKSYHKPISCSTGMMEGMTFGMMAGFMVGALLGATNGMFWGSTLGMLIGCVAGVWAGRPSGVMGVMEGLMAGVMSGTMGAMLSVMLLAEPLALFLALLIGLCVLIMVALAYMQVKELGVLGEKARAVSITSMASVSLIFFSILSWIMIYGPKSGPVWRG